MIYPENRRRAPSRRKIGANHSTRRQLSIEPLESRRMFAVFTVSSLADAPVFAAEQAPGTLRQAIFDANLSSGDDEIVFDAALTSGGPAAINLTAAGELLIHSNMTISGPGAGLLTIRAYDPTPETNDGDGARIFRIATSPEGSIVTIQGLTLTGGDVTGAGGAILNEGILTLSACTISDSSATGQPAIGGGGGGIAISASGSATVTDSTISGNTARSDYAYGGGISAAGYLSVVRSLISGNHADGKGFNYGVGGGISASPSVIAKITDSTISDNLAEGTRANGGGVSAGGDLTIERTKITGNKAEGSTHAYGGGVSTAAQTVVNNSEIASNQALLLSPGTAQGGGIESRQSLMVTNSSIVDNHAAQFGGGLSIKTLAIITNSTLSGNSAPQGGGVAVGADAFGSANIAHSTITLNRADVDGGGIHVAVGANASLDHTIIAGNTLVSTQRQDISGTLFARYTLIGDDSGASVVDSGGNQIGHAATPIDPLLSPLTQNGGPTRTHLPLDGSPVIDAGDPALMVGNEGVPPTDQRGVPFTRVFDGKLPAGAQIDIGAIERQSSGPPAIAGDFNRDLIVNAADYTVWRDTLSLIVEAYAGADADGNGKVEIADYEIWKTQFGQSLGSGSGAESAANEPVAAILMTVSTEVSAMPLANDAGLPPAANREAAPASNVVRRFATSHRAVRIDDRLNLTARHPRLANATGDENTDSELPHDGATPSTACEIARAADAVFHALGSRRRGR